MVREVGREETPSLISTSKKHQALIWDSQSSYSSLSETKQGERSRNAWAEVEMFSIVANRVSVVFQARAALGEI